MNSSNKIHYQVYVTKNHFYSDVLIPKTKEVYYMCENIMRSNLHKKFGLIEFPKYNYENGSSCNDQYCNNISCYNERGSNCPARINCENT